MSTILDRICADKRKLVAEQKNSPPHFRIAQTGQRPGSAAWVQEMHGTGCRENGFWLDRRNQKGFAICWGDPAGIRPRQTGPRLQAWWGRMFVGLDRQTVFQASEGDLGAALACDLPVLRKDFMVDSYQVVEARALGADCILLIVGALTDDELSNYEDIALGYEMDVLVEVHDEAELERALKLKSHLIGVNNRDLKTMKTDIATTERLAPMIPKDYMLVSESGIESPGDIKRLQAAGAQGILMGKSLLKRSDVEQAVKVLFAGAGVAVART